VQRREQDRPEGAVGLARIVAQSQGAFRAALALAADDIQAADRQVATRREP